MSRQVEGYILSLLAARGLVEQELIDTLRRATEPASPGSGVWGARLQVLIRDGAVEEAQLVELLTELAEQGVMSWSGITEHEPDTRPRRVQEAGEARGAAVDDRAWVHCGGLVDSGGSDGDEGRDRASLECGPSAITTMELPDGVVASSELGRALFPGTWQRYRVIERLGIGGMGEVFKAYDPVLKRFVALKFLRDDDPVLQQRFEREARAQARVDHPNVCEVYEVGEVGGHPYIAMRYIEGSTLQALKGKLGPEATARLMRAVALAVHAAHRQGLIHRDLKPGNILVECDEDGELVPYVVDFGLARDLSSAGLTVTGAVSGTPAYMSPEQALGEADQLDRRSDLYSLGAVFYELISGQRPHIGTTDMAALLKIISEDVVALRRIDRRVPEDLATIIMTCLERKPERRFDSARALAEDLDRFLDGEPIRARPPSTSYLVRKWVRKNRALAAAVGLGLVVSLLLSGAMVHNRWQASIRARLAQRFGYVAKEIEDTVRLAALLPRQDTTSFRALVQRWMDGIEAEMKSLGQVGEGPGLYALGRGAMALGQLAEARAYLEQAIDSGEQEPEVHSALGQVLAQQYRQARDEAERVADPELRRIRLEVLAESLMEPALNELRLSLVGRERDAGFERSLIAFYERRFDEAIATARKVYQEQPWRYEARRLEAEILLTRAAEAAEATEFDLARALLEDARLIHEEVLSVARSAGMVYLDECHRRSTLLRIDLMSRAVDESRLEQAIAPCREALEVEPQLALAEAQQGEIHVMWARDSINRGADPHQALTAAIRSAERAIELDPDSAAAHEIVGWSAELLARWQYRRGIDPSDSIDRATRAMERALAINPASADAYNHLSKALFTRALFLSARGEDPGPALEQMIESCKRAIEVYPGYAAGFSNLGTAYVRLAERKIAIGEDPGQTIEDAVTVFDRAIELQPNRAVHFNNRGNAFLTLAEHQINQEAEPFAALANAASSYSRASEMRPGFAIYYFNIGLCARYRALALLLGGKSPLHACDRAVAVLDKGLKLNPEDSDFLLESARAQIIAARWLRMQGLDPGPALASARNAAERGLRLNRADCWLHASVAETWFWQIEGLDGGEQRVIPGAFEAGLAAADQALALNPTLKEALAISGALLLQAAEAAGNEEQAPELRRRGLDRLEQARSSKGALDPQLEAVLMNAGQS